jgi:hypothetical protein
MAAKSQYPAEGPGNKTRFTGDKVLMTARLPLQLLALAAVPVAPPCAGCSLEQKELIADLSFLMDEFIPDPEDLEELFEAEDLGPPPPGPRSRWQWAEALLPTVGLKVQVPLSGSPGRHVTWEVFLFFNLSR